MADGGPSGNFLELGHDFEQLIDEQAGQSPLSLRSRLSAEGHRGFHDLEKPRAHFDARRERIDGLVKQLFNRHLQCCLPTIELRDHEVGALIFLRSNFADGSTEPLRDTANRKALAPPCRAQFMQPARLQIANWCGSLARRFEVPIQFRLIHSKFTCGVRLATTPKAEKSAPPLHLLR
jgi:hypothetical protein